MRKALNDNPVAQILILGLLAVVVAFLLVTRVMHKSGGSTQSPATTTSATEVPSAPASTVPVAPSAGGVAAPDASAGALSSKFVAGPGLPQPVARAYSDDKAIVLFVFRNHGIDDAAVHASVERLRGRPDLAVFVTHAGHIARYARITEGVDVNRVPALVVVRPRRLAQGVPSAIVSYGFRDALSVQQTVRDALYKGPTDLPYYPR